MKKEWRFSKYEGKEKSLVKRLLAKEDVEFQTKKEIREKLIKDGIIS